MCPRIQVILDEEDIARFKLQAQRESKSLSAWLREAGRKMLELSNKHQELKNPEALKLFFQRCDACEAGKEPEWEEHKRVILEGYKTKSES